MGKRVAHLLSTKWVERVLRGAVEDGRYPDGNCLHCLVRGHSASWLYLRTVKGKQRVYTIGSVRKLADLSGSIDVGKRAKASLDAARAKAAEFRANIAQGKPPKAVLSTSYPTLSDIVSYYCKFKGIEVKATNSFVAPFEPIYSEYGPVFSKEMGVAYRDYLVKHKKSDNTIMNYTRLLKGMFTIYISDHATTDIVNPLDGVRFQKTETSINNRDPLPIDVIKKVYDALEGDYKKLWLTLAVTGARLNEIYGIKSKDIADGFINIEPNEIRRLKNAASKRVIPLFIKLPKRDRKQYFDDMASVSALSQKFQAQINKHIPKEFVGKRQMTCHSLRHSLTDYMKLKNVPQTLEDAFLGHSAKDTSNRVYGSIEGRKQAMKENLGPVIAQYLKEIGIDA